MRPLNRIIPMGITVVLGLIAPPFSLFAEAPDIGPGDVYIEMDEGAEGFNLFIRAAANLGSVLITESSADPAKRADSFAFRAWDYNPVNGDERRILDGEFLESERPLYFLLDSTPEPNPLLGSAYHIYVPLQLTYGYPWSREGQIDVHRGTWLNIRAFERPYADYRGEWRDKAFVLSMNELPPPPEPELEPGGPVFEEGPVEGIEQAVERITEIIEFSGGNIDVV